MSDRRSITRLVIPTLIFTTVMFGMLVWPPLRLADLVDSGFELAGWHLLVLIVLPIVGRISYELRPGPFSRMVAALSLTWFGLCFLLFALLLPVELLLFLFPIPEPWAGIALAITWFALGVGALVNAQVLHVRTLRFESPRIDRALRLVQISDVHIGSRSAGFLTRVATRVADLEPDLVAITGDLVDFKDIPAADLAPLGRMGCPVYFCIGNHERYVDCDAICERLREHGVRVLRDSVEISQQGPVFIGIDDAESKRRVERGLEKLGTLPDGFRVLLYHRPDGLEAAAAAGVDLMLCGHTHNGQIIPFNWAVRRVFPRIQGLYRVDPARLYVSPGTGTWGPVMRLGSRNEITQIELQPTF